MYQLIGINLDTGCPQAGSDGFWRGVVAQLRLTPKQVGAGARARGCGSRGWAAGLARALRSRRRPCLWPRPARRVAAHAPMSARQSMSRRPPPPPPPPPPPQLSAALHAFKPQIEDSVAAYELYNYQASR
jgi:hypothetical protein